MRYNPDTTGRTPPKGLVVYHYYEGDDDPQMDRWAQKAWDIALASPIRKPNPARPSARRASRRRGKR
jgi:hypothetical protein